LRALFYLPRIGRQCSLAWSFLHVLGTRHFCFHFFDPYRQALAVVSANIDNSSQTS
jgi:hypothetical protein